MTRCRFLVAALLLWCAAPARAADPPLPAELDLVPRDADLVVSVRVAKLWASELFQSYREFIGAGTEELAGMFGVRPDDLDRFTAVAAGDDAFAILTTLKPTDRKKVLSVFAPHGVERKSGTATCYRDETKWTTVAFVGTHTVLVGTPSAVEAYLRRGPKKDGPHAEALTLAVKHDAVFAATAGTSGMKLLAASLPDPFKKLSPLLTASYGVATLDAAPAGPKKGDVPKLELRAALRYAAKKDADAAAVAVGDLRTLAHQGIEKLKGEWAESGPPGSDDFQHGLYEAIKAVGGADIGRDTKPPANDRELLLTATVRGSKDIGTLAFSLLLEISTRHFVYSGNPPKPDANVQALADALLAYVKEHGRLPPPAIYAKDGKTPLLSWRVLLLPYLGDDAKKLHAQFKLDEPWDGEHNIRLVAKMPKVFAPAGDEFTGATTRFQVFTGPDTLFPGPKGFALADATDGAANTILLAQALRPVPWSKPQDLEYAAKKPVPLLGGEGFSLTGPHVQVAFADGTVRAFYAPLKSAAKPGVITSDSPFGTFEGWSDDFYEGALRALVTPAGGEKAKPEAGFRKPR